MDLSTCNWISLTWNNARRAFLFLVFPPQIWFMKAFAQIAYVLSLSEAKIDWVAANYR